MHNLVKSPGLFVMQIEVDVYNLLKLWTFLKLHPSWTGSWKDVRSETSRYFQSRDSECRFLESADGKAFVTVFSGMRLCHVINDLRSMQLLDDDRIVPEGYSS